MSLKFIEISFSEILILHYMFWTKAADQFANNFKSFRFSSIQVAWFGEKVAGIHRTIDHPKFIPVVELRSVNLSVVGSSISIFFSDDSFASLGINLASEALNHEIWNYTTRPDGIKSDGFIHYTAEKYPCTVEQLKLVWFILGPGDRHFFSTYSMNI